MQRVKTEDLVNMLATGVEAVDTRRAAIRRVAVLTIAAVCSVGFVAFALGFNPRLEEVVAVPQFWLREAFCAGLALIGFALVRRLAHPGMRLGLLPGALAALVLAMWLVAAAVLGGLGPAARGRALLGTTASVCPWLIAVTALPPLLALLWLLRSLAPTRLRLAGATAGFTAGAIGAIAYTLHCPEIAPPFVALWYLLGMLIPASVGAMLGPRALRW